MPVSRDKQLNVWLSNHELATFDAASSFVNRRDGLRLSRGERIRNLMRLFVIEVDRQQELLREVDHAP